MPRSHTDPIPRFWGFVNKNGPNGCWEWIGCRNTFGYGQFVPIKRQQWHAHRYSYELHRGKIPDGLTLDHLCRNRGCVNPEHLEAVTEAVNILRGESPAARNARKTHCYKGHPFDEENTYWYTKKSTGKPSRLCRRCRLEANKRFVFHQKDRD